MSRASTEFPVFFAQALSSRNSVHIEFRFMTLCDIHDSEKALSRTEPFLDSFFLECSIESFPFVSWIPPCVSQADIVA